MEVPEVLVSPFQQKLGFTQMLRIFRVDTSNAYISVSILAQQGPFQVWSHMITYSFKSYKLDLRLTFVSGIARRASKVASRQTKAERYM